MKVSTANTESRVRVAHVANKVFTVRGTHTNGYAEEGHVMPMSEWIAVQAELEDAKAQIAQLTAARATAHYLINQALVDIDRSRHGLRIALTAISPIIGESN